MNPVYWLLIWMAATVLACTIVAIVFFRLGWDHCEVEQDRMRRHTHREGDPAPGVLLELPTAGRLDVLDDLPPILRPPRRESYTPWVFAGGWDQGPVAESAEYELLTQTTELTDTGEMRALTDERIAKMVGDTNEFIFAMKDAG